MWKNYYCLQGNRDDSDVLMYYTTTGWMMWNWMVSALALGKALRTEVGLIILLKFPLSIGQLKFLQEKGGKATRDRNYTIPTPPPEGIEALQYTI